MPRTVSAEHQKEKMQTKAALRQSVLITRKILMQNCQSPSNNLQKLVNLKLALKLPHQ